MTKEKRFDLSSTANDILNTEGMSEYLGFFFSEIYLGMLDEKTRNLPLGEVKELLTMPWGKPYISDELIGAGNVIVSILEHDTIQFFPLWQEEHASYHPGLANHSKGKVCLFTPKDMLASKNEKPVIICPGGGFNTVAFLTEGFPVAEAFFEKGYKPFILNYRVNPDAQYPNPMFDLMLAVKFVRANAERFGIDPDELLVLGFSAAGHLAGSEAIKAPEYENALLRELAETEPKLAEKYRDISAIPNMVSLCYPVITFSGDTHLGTVVNTVGDDAAKREEWSIEKHVTPAYPKTFLWACEDDGTVPYTNTVLMDNALTEAGVSHLCRIYPTGGHGISLGIGTSAEGWFEEMCRFFA